MGTLRDLWDSIRPHIAGVGLLVTWIGIAILYYRRRVDWRSKRFSNVVNFSLNYVADNKLMMRTLLETSTTTVWLNEYGVKLVQQAAAKTRHDQPFIILKDAMDMRFVKRAALNVMSARFPEVFLGTALGADVKKATFVYAVTFENYPDMRTRKFRVLLVEQNCLDASFGPETAEPGVIEEAHRDRLPVLRMMQRLTKEPTAVANGAEIIGKVELGVVV